MKRQLDVGKKRKLSNESAKRKSDGCDNPSKMPSNVTANKLTDKQWRVHRSKIGARKRGQHNDHSLADKNLEIKHPPNKNVNRTKSNGNKDGNNVGGNSPNNRNGNRHRKHKSPDGNRPNNRGS